MAKFLRIQYLARVGDTEFASRTINTDEIADYGPHAPKGGYPDGDKLNEVKADITMKNGTNYLVPHYEAQIAAHLDVGNAADLVRPLPRQESPLRRPRIERSDIEPRG